MCKINEKPFTDSKNTLGAVYILRDPRNLIDASVREIAATLFTGRLFTRRI